MTIKELEEYAFHEALKYMSAVERSENEEAKDYYKGKVNAFLHIVAVIQNGGKVNAKEKDADVEEE